MKENKLTIFINKPVKEVFEYSLESNNVPKWINSIKEEIPEERPVKLGTKLRNIGVDSQEWNKYEVIDFQPPRTFTLKRLKRKCNSIMEFIDYDSNDTQIEWRNTCETRIS